MTDQDLPSSPGASDRSHTPSPGTLLRQARESRRMHIGVLAATLKVPPQRLEALEADRYDELLDATFVRSLAHSVCRVLKVDPAPILLGLPRQEAVASTLAELHEGARPLSGQRRAVLESPREAGRGLRVWALLLVVVALLVWQGPLVKDWLGQRWPAMGGVDEPTAPPAAQPTQPTVPEGVGGGATSSETTTPLNNSTASMPSPSTPLSADTAPKLEAKGESWVEIKDGQGTVTWSGTVVNGQTLTLEGVAPWTLVIGNASAVSLRHKGLEVDLEPHTKANVARLTLNP